jgi:transposase, IS5 family
MTPKEKRPTGQQPLMGSRLEFLIDLDHELVRLAQIIPWDAVAQELQPMYAPGNGRPAIATRLMAGLHVLKHTYGLSDEQVVVRWTENPYSRTTRGKLYSLHAPEVECIATICEANRAASAKPMAGAKPRGP